ncbi:lipid-transfer protein [Gordonia pseudamarae]|jgi:acetyl-CoA acetyltransferase|uniref:Lipid-transfer protein n=1 Tax=Gordonia pseudamarae TaxID=2831662 RepID=A0ABX6IFM0_9ACTN|nr:MULTISPECIES: lipid-transfer protein [Gordonia]MBD0021591.1 lipid-transfer protein [Gordonia sp. (in: high G+C Gram-positive bacteria)]QHN25127.1 lipid-transfer protein [Gordonia pseudamarae]QHN34060.1 lipid-transfer protein [Gordonia pseudamarae]
MNNSGAAIVGIGTTEYSKKSGRSELCLAAEASLAALADAGVAPGDVDGFVTFSIDNNDESTLARNLGVYEVDFFARTSAGGGGAPGAIALAAMAIETGKASVVLCYRAMNERSGRRFGQPLAFESQEVTTAEAERAWSAPFGMATPAAFMAHSARRYMHQYNVDAADFGLQPVVQREYAVTNPDAFFYGKPMALDDHQASRMIADPLRLLDCCQETDGGVALVVTSADRAAQLRHAPVRVLGSAMGIAARQHGMASMYRDDIAGVEETKIVGDQLYRQSDLAPADLDVAVLYDHFSPAILMQLEALGFCGPGEAPDLVRDGATRIDGAIPTNTNGGQLSEAYMHGFNGLVEAVRQLRGTAVNQVPDARHAIVTGGPYVATSGVILGVA